MTFHPSDKFQYFMRGNGILHLRTAPCHPQTNGQAERFVQTIKKSMTAMGHREDLNKKYVIC